MHEPFLYTASLHNWDFIKWKFTLPLVYLPSFHKGAHGLQFTSPHLPTGHNKARSSVIQHWQVWNHNMKTLTFLANVQRIDCKEICCPNNEWWLKPTYLTIWKSHNIRLIPRCLYHVDICICFIFYTTQILTLTLCLACSSTRSRLAFAQPTTNDQHTTYRSRLDNMIVNKWYQSDLGTRHHRYKKRWKTNRKD